MPKSEMVSPARERWVDRHGPSYAAAVLSGHVGALLGAGMEDEAGMERGEPTDTMRGGLDDEDEAAAPGELAQVRAALVQAHAEGVVTAAAAAAWVLGKLAAAAELWQALMQHCRSSLDDFTLVPVDDTDWEMLDRSACRFLCRINELCVNSHNSCPSARASVPVGKF
jgi:hypothetical protein